MRLVARGISHTFDAAECAVLDGATFEVATGESVAILGPSGSGKSTLLSVLGGLLAPDVGTVGIVEGDDPDASLLPGTTRHACAWVLQTTNVLPERTARDNVAFAGLARGMARAGALALADDALEDVGLTYRAHTQARLLSGGELQRVVVARALTSGRPFILADEPTGQLDARTSEVVLDALLAARASSGAVGLVVVTHDAAVAERCDRTVRIHLGKVVNA